MAAEVLTKLTVVLKGAGTAFPATQHHVVVLADCFVFTAQAVRFHVPIEPLGIVEGALCQEQLGVRTEGGWRNAYPYVSKGAFSALSQINLVGTETFDQGSYPEMKERY